MTQQDLLDVNLYKVIARCYIHNKRPDAAEISVVYADGAKETIWTFNPMRHSFNYHEFVGKTKIEAVFYCDRKPPRSVTLF